MDLRTACNVFRATANAIPNDVAIVKLECAKESIALRKNGKLACLACFAFFGDALVASRAAR